jgi:hypothetical protein
MECYFQSCGVSLGYAKTSGRPFCLLERVVRQSSKCSSVKVGLVLFYFGVFREGKEIM